MEKWNITWIWYELVRTKKWKNLEIWDILQMNWKRFFVEHFLLNDKFTMIDHLFGNNSFRTRERSKLNRRENRKIMRSSPNLKKLDWRIWKYNSALRNLLGWTLKMSQLCNSFRFGNHWKNTLSLLKILNDQRFDQITKNGTPCVAWLNIRIVYHWLTNKIWSNLQSDSKWTKNQIAHFPTFISIQKKNSAPFERIVKQYAP